MNPNSIMIDDEKYVKESEIKKQELNITVNKSVAEAFVGRKVIVRSRNEGINAGTIVAADDTGIVLSDCRRIWYHKPKSSDLAWYEGVAKSGLHDDSKVSCTVNFKVIVEDYSITDCEIEAFKSIMEKTPHGS